jgi:type IX secretion system PorP/SprF family membrane protein
MAGLDDYWNINVDHRQQWSNFPGSPVTSSLTIDRGFAHKAGFGLNITDDKAGLLRQTRVMGSYAYHLPLSESQRLNFGVSLGLDDSRLNTHDISGDVSEEEISLYNQLKPYLDGDFGISYTDSSLFIGTAVPNLKSAFFKTSDARFDADRLLFIAQASYKIPVGEGGSKSFVFEPLAAYRIVRGYNNIGDVGFNFFFNNYGLYWQTVYHTSQNAGMGFGLSHRYYTLGFSYNMETGMIGGYTSGAFELNLKLRLF